MENKLELINAALRHARDVIGLLDRPAGCYNFEDFATPELRDMYYRINSMCIAVTAMQEAAGE